MCFTVSGKFSHAGSHGSSHFISFERTIDRRTKLVSVDDVLVAGTGYPDFRNEYPVVTVLKLVGEEMSIIPVG